MDESTGITNKRVVTDWRTQAARRGGLRPSIVIKGKGQDPQAHARGGRSPLLRWRSTPFSRSKIRCQGEGGRRRWRVSRREAPRPATSPAVCRAWRNCSKPASPKEAAIIAEIEGTHPLRQATTRTSAASRSSRWTKTAGARGISDPEGQAHCHLQDGDIVEKGDLRSSRAIPRRTTFWRSRASRNSLRIWSTKSRKSTGCRACSSTTSISK